MSRQAKIAYQPRSDRWPDLLAPNEMSSALVHDHIIAGINKASTTVRCITLCTFRTKTTCTRDKNSIDKESGSDSAFRDVFGIILHEHAGTDSSPATLVA